MNEVDPWDGGTTPTLILASVEAADFHLLRRAEKMARLRTILRQHDEERDLHERMMRMVERANVPLWVRLRRRWREAIYETDRYTSYGTSHRATGSEDHV